jgi:hypothetical protein
MIAFCRRALVGLGCPGGDFFPADVFARAQRGLDVAVQAHVFEAQAGAGRKNRQAVAVSTRIRKSKERIIAESLWFGEGVTRECETKSRHPMDIKAE